MSMLFWRPMQIITCKRCYCSTWKSSVIRPDLQSDQAEIISVKMQIDINRCNNKYESDWKSLKANMHNWKQKCFFCFQFSLVLGWDQLAGHRIPGYPLHPKVCRWRFRSFQIEGDQLEHFGKVGVMMPTCLEIFRKCCRPLEFWPGKLMGIQCIRAYVYDSMCM